MSVQPDTIHLPAGSIVPASIASPGAQLAAAGAPLTLPNGHAVRVRFGFRALMQLEQEFGGLGNIQAAVSRDGSGETLKPTLMMLAAGLQKQHDGAGAPLTFDRLADLLDDAPPSEVQQWLEVAGEAVTAAMVEAFPPPKDAEGNEPTDPTASPGLTGTTPPPSASDAQTTPSG